MKIQKRRNWPQNWNSYTVRIKKHKTAETDLQNWFWNCISVFLKTCINIAETDPKTFTLNMIFKFLYYLFTKTNIAETDPKTKILPSGQIYPQINKSFFFGTIHDPRSECRQRFCKKAVFFRKKFSRCPWTEVRKRSICLKQNLFLLQIMILLFYKKTTRKNWSFWLLYT